MKFSTTVLTDGQVKAMIRRGFDKKKLPEEPEDTQYRLDMEKLYREDIYNVKFSSSLK